MSFSRGVHDDREARVDRLAFRWLLAGCVALLLTMAAPWLVGRAWTSDDLGAYHLPVREFYARCLATGWQFDWMPTLFNGFYLSGEGQCGTYHPWHWLLYRVLPVRVAFGLEILVNYPLMLIGAFHWLRQHVPRRAPALFGGVVFTFASFNFLHFVHPNAIAVTAHLPWLLFCIARWSATGRMVAWVSLAIPCLTASQVLCGYPQYVWLSALAEGVYAFCMLRPAAASAFWLVWLKAIGLLLGAVQILPTWDVLQSSERALESGNFFLQYSFSPVLLVQLLAPYFVEQSHEMGFYLGALPLLLLVVLAVHPRLEARSRRLLATCGVCALLAFILAMGSHGVIFRLTRWLPIIGTFRVPARYLMLVQLSLAPPAAVAFARLVVDADDVSRRKSTFCLVTVSLASLTITAMAAWLSPPEDPVRQVLQFSTPVAFGGSAVLLAMLPRRRQLILPLLALLSLGDLAAHGLSGSVLRNTRRWDDRVGMVPPPGRPQDRIVVETETLGLERDRFHGNGLTLLGWSQADGYAGLMARSQLFGEGASLSGLRAANVRWVLAARVPPGLEGLQTGHASWLEVPNPSSRFRLVSRTVVAEDIRAAMRNVDPDNTAIVATPITLGPASAGSVTALRDEPGKISLHVDCQSTQFLVITERHHAGWTATMDGDSLPVHRANGDFMGCVVPTGKHRLTLVFSPASLRWGKWGSLAGIILVLGTAAVPFLARRTHRRRAHTRVELA